MDSASNSNRRDLQADVEDAVSDSTKEQVAQCARLLATYLALYKHKYGELTTEEYAELNEQLSDSLEFGEAVYCSGLQEMLETLALVEVYDLDQPKPPRTSRMIN